MQLVTGTQMQTIEKEAFANLAISPLVVMETAGSRIIEVLKKEYGCLKGKRVHILAGTGNNGGDGLVAARQLLALEARVKVYLVGNQQKLSPENETNLNILRNIGADFQVVEGIQIGRLKFSLGLADLVIDAIFGTGFRDSLDPKLEALISVVNEVKCPVVAVDCPTGVNASTGEVRTVAIEADLTINLGLLKIGCALYPGRAYAGKNILVDLGFPLISTVERFLLHEGCRDWLARRAPWSHKGTFGHTLVVAGSKNMAGAAALSAQAVLRGGGGMVTLAVPEETYNRFTPDEVMVVPVPQSDGGTIGVPSLQTLLEIMEDKDVLAIGPGLTTVPETIQVVQELLRTWSGPCVIDADALSALDEGFLQEIPEKKRNLWIVTPHPGEMARLQGMEITEVNANRLQVVESYAAKWGMVVLLKGASTIIADQKHTYVNSTGNPGMATAGSGDVLTGLIAALLGQGLSPLKAAALGAYIHGEAGDRAALNGQRGLKAGDSLKELQAILS